MSVVSRARSRPPVGRKNHRGFDRVDKIDERSENPQSIPATRHRRPPLARQPRLARCQERVRSFSTSKRSSSVLRKRRSSSTEIRKTRRVSRTRDPPRPITSRNALDYALSEALSLSLTDECVSEARPAISQCIPPQ